MVAAPEKKHTAAQLILLAADDLMTSGLAEFSEWDLTVAAWSRDRFKFGLRGYAQTYPDHKRVMMEIMGSRAHSPVQMKLLEKVRPNYYRLTPLGRATAARLREGPKPVNGARPVTVKDLYDSAAGYLNRAEFRRWKDSPEEPRDWSGAAAFLGLTGKASTADPVEMLDEVEGAIKAAMDWCNTQGVVFLTKGSGQGGTPIHVSELSEMVDFLQALRYRFPDFLEKRPGKPKKRFSD